MCDLLLDLQTIVARLEQVQEEGGPATANEIVVERIWSCDLRRLKEHVAHWGEGHCAPCQSH